MRFHWVAAIGLAIFHVAMGNPEEAATFVAASLVISAMIQK